MRSEDTESDGGRQMQHIDIPSDERMRQLAAHRHPGSVSLYLPTGVGPDDGRRARSDLASARDRVAGILSRVAPEEADAVTAALDELADDIGFFEEVARTLAVFVSGEHIETYRVANRLPQAVTVSDRFRLTPLLRAATVPGDALVLALSANAVRLISIAADGSAAEIPVPGMPHDVAGYAGPESVRERSYSIKRVGAEGEKVRLTRFARAVESALRPVLADARRPLILAATEPLAGIYRSINSYHGLARAALEGNPDDVSADELAGRARTVLDALHADRLARLRADYDAGASAGRALSDPSDVARAAAAGAIDTLLADFENPIPGWVDDTGEVHFEEATDETGPDVVDDIVRMALATGARVLAVRAPDLPTPRPLAAILRYRI